MDVVLPSSELMYSAGVVVIKDGKILGICNLSDGSISLPKGRIEQGETAAEAAVRECLEETGVVCETIAEVAVQLRYSEAIKKTKAVYWHLAEYKSQAESMNEEHESFETRWVDEGKLTFKSDREIANIAQSHLNSLQHTD